MIISWHEILSWFIAVVSATLFFTEHRKNDNTKYYMVLQGILRACGQRSGFLANTLGRLQESGRDVPCVKGGVNLDHFGGAKVDQLVKG